MKCGDMMTKDPVACTPDDDCCTVARLLRDHDVGSLPVVTSEEDRRVVGMITDRDICIRVCAEDLLASDINVDEVMSIGVVTCSVDDDVDQATERMEEHRIRRIPVIDAKGLLVGIIAQADIARRHHEKAGEVVEQVSQPTAKAA